MQYTNYITCYRWWEGGEYGGGVLWSVQGHPLLLHTRDWFRSGHPAPGYPLLIGPQWSVGFSPSFVHYPLLTNGEAGISPSPPPPQYRPGPPPPPSLWSSTDMSVWGGGGRVS
jgi:hypothetical protein